MVKNGRIAFLVAALCALFLCGCPLGIGQSDQSAAGGVSRAPTLGAVAIGSGTPFQALFNPVIYKYDPAINHYSADPSVQVINNVAVGGGAPRDLIVMITSTDLPKEGGNEWTMNGTHIYTTFGENNLRTWYEYGNANGTGLLDESDLPWVKPGTHSMFAPDIQFVPGMSGWENQLYFYIPDKDKDGVWHIGVAHTQNYGSILYDGMAIEDGWFTIGDGPGGSPKDKNKPVSCPGDPGVFFDPVQKAYYMAYVESGYRTPKNLSVVKLNSDMKSGSYEGPITFTGEFSNYGDLNNYMEAPDIFSLTAPNQTTPNYYLVFSAEVEGQADDKTGYIGYAMATPQAFKKSPAGCWQFKGWIFRNLHTGRSNHATLAQANGQYYVFFQRDTEGNKDKGRMRQVCAKEIELASDGTILGVSLPAWSDNGKKNLYGTLDGRTISVARGFINFKDEKRTDPHQAVIHFSSLKNVTGTALSNFKLLYYLDIEPGCNLVVDATASVNFTLPPRYLTHIRERTWAVEFDCKPGTSIAPGNVLGGEDVFTLRYEGGADFNKDNDYSQPIGDYFTRTTRVALFDINADPLVADPLCGEKSGSETDPREAMRKYLHADHLDANKKYTYLTCSGSDANVGINNQYLNTGWTSQEWTVEPVTDFAGLPPMSPQDKANAFRFKNVWTGYYMTCNDKDRTGSDGQHYFWLLSQALHYNNSGHANWETQVWIREDMRDNSGRLTGYFRLRSDWVTNDSNGDGKPDNWAPLYLTLNYDPKNPSADTGKHDVYVQPSHADWDSQRWTYE